MNTRSLILRRAAALLAALALLGPWARPATAAQGTQAPTYSFVEMGLDGRELVSPSDRQILSFSLPAGQQVAAGASLTLDLRTSLLAPSAAEATGDEVAEAEAAAAAAADPTADLGGTLQISFNGVPLSTLPLTAEPQRTVELEIPAEALATPPADGRYNLSVVLSVQADCELGDAVRVAIGDESRFTLPTKSAPISASLAALPAPLYQRSFLPETALLVVPDAPSPAELRAAMIVAGGLGRSTGTNLGLSLRRSGDLTPAERNGNHLVLVGVPANLPQLAELELPAAVTDGLFAAPNLSADDGLVQTAISPWNKAKLTLAVGGNSEAGLLKAAQAFALNQLLLNPEQPDLALIASLNAAPDEIPPVERSFTELGYPDPRKTTSVGISSLYYEFTLPAGQMATDEAFVELVFAHAAVINFDESSLTVLLNGVEIGGARLSPDTVSVNRTRLVMPTDLLRPGRNDLQLRITLAPPSGCVDRDTLDAWLNVLPTSRVSVPLEPAVDRQLRSISLDEYPTFLSDSPSLADAVVVVKADDPASWDVAANIVAGLATQTTDAPVDLDLAFDGALSDSLRQERTLIVVGLPSQLALVSELNNQLPAPFEPNSDAAIDRVSRVAFRLAAEQDVGYLELLNSPWNDQRFVLTALGNSPAGVAQAGEALVRGSLRSQLGGSFALIVNDQVFIGGTRLASSSPAAAPTPAPAGTAEAAGGAAPPPAENANATAPDAGPPLALALVGSVLFMLAVIGGVVGFGIYRRNRGEP